MKNEIEFNFLKVNQKYFISIFFILFISFIIFFKNSLFQSSFLLKELGKKSIDPEIAFITNKPIFLEFYAEWCEVCKKMSPSINRLNKEYGNDINFVFLNVDNPKWEKYVRKMNVNGIPQINLFDKELNLKTTFIGLQDVSDVNEAVESLLSSEEGKNIANLTF